ncbi:hypothetical protein INR49_010101 [Caranx melampygus]|nr:hypothetical protein INR49_010101 [Caranx melampygus]
MATASPGPSGDIDRARGRYVPTAARCPVLKMSLEKKRLVASGGLKGNSDKSKTVSPSRQQRSGESRSPQGHRPFPGPCAARSAASRPAASCTLQVHQVT